MSTIFNINRHNERNNTFFKITSTFTLEHVVNLFNGFYARKGASTNERGQGRKQKRSGTFAQTD